MEKSIRINARLDRETAPRIRYLAKRTGLNVSGIVKESIHYFYEQVRAREEKTPEILLKSCFVGSGQGDQELSETYKNGLSKNLAKKHDHC